jgi:hypothetical protein
MEEQWKDIPGYEGFYQASTSGRIRSIDRCVVQRNDSTQLKKGKILSPSINRTGYSFCALSKNNILKGFPLHKLISITFLGDTPFNYREINHIDGVKTNNHIDNLEWTTRSKNINHAIKLGLLKYKKGEDHFSSKFSNTEMFEIMAERLSGKTLVELGKKYHVFPSTISRITEKQIKLNQ